MSFHLRSSSSSYSEEEMELFRKEEKYMMQVYKRHRIVLKEGRGAIVKDFSGKKYIDCIEGIAVNNLGHCHPSVVEAIKDQAEKLIQVSNLYYSENQVVLAEKLSEISGMDKVFFSNSGTEAVEAALKLAKKMSGKTGFIAAEGSFHGRTMGSLSVTSKEEYRKPFEPLVPGVCFVPYNDAEAVRDKIDGDTAAVILEPIQVESGGINIPDDEYLPSVREICDEKGVLLILDEVQTGFGRTGRWFYKDYFNGDAEPDIMTVAKSMGGGFPIGAMLAKEGIEFERGQHGSTFAGNPLACAAALASIRVIEEEKLVERASVLGAYFMEKLSSMAKRLSLSLRSDLVKELRGKGLLIGIELTKPCDEIVEKGMERGILINCIAEKVIRLVPPLIISKDEIDEVVSVLYELLSGS